jgi:hypothetical protein
MILAAIACGRHTASNGRCRAARTIAQYDYQYGRKEPQAAANQPAVLTQDRSRKSPPAA